MPLSSIDPPAAKASQDLQDLIETACHNAVHAMHAESFLAHREQRSPEAHVILAAALDVLVENGITAEQLQHCAQHLRSTAAPRRAA